MIIAHLALDVHSLLACSLTCSSWYIAAIPHLHRTIIAQTYPWCTNKKSIWPTPLRNMHKLGLLPLVKRFQFHGGCHISPLEFSPKRFNYYTLRHFSALTNVQELGIDFLDIPGFIPRIRRYFGHFLPTLRSLALREPKGTCRQIVYFIGLFEHLEDLKLLCNVSYPLRGERADDQALVPPSVPPLRGRLTMMRFRRVELLKEMIGQFGGIRFRWMNLYDVDGMQLLLGASAKTLETLWLHPSDPRGKEFLLNNMQVLTDKFVVRYSPRDFDLSRNKSLRTIQIATWSLDDALQACPRDIATSLLTYALSTITSSVFSYITVFYRDYATTSTYSSWPGQSIPELPYENGIETWIAEEASRHDRRFGLFRTLHKVRDFRLVLCADVWNGAGEFSEQMLKKAVAAEKAERGFDGIFPEPLVTHNLREAHYGYLEGFWADHPFHWIPP